MTIDWANFTPFASLAGGALIGFSALVLVLLGGRIAGVSRIVGALFKFKRSDTLWRLLFVLGLLLSPSLYQLFAPLPAIQIDTSSLLLGLSGALVGFGTRLGSGCTSGHGVCGISRLSLRSLVATLCFVCVGFATVFVMRHFILLAG